MCARAPFSHGALFFFLIITLCENNATRQKCDYRGTCAGPDFVVCMCTRGDVCLVCAAVVGGLFIMLCKSSAAKPLLSQHRVPPAPVC